MKHIVSMCEPALYTKAELQSYTRTSGQYNYTRLKAVLEALAFDASGNYVVHSKFLRGQSMILLHVLINVNVIILL